MSDIPESRVQEIRIERGLIPADVARSADMDPSTYNKVDKGKRGVSPQFVRQIASALQVPQSELYAPIGSPIPPRPHVTGEITQIHNAAPLSHITIPEYDVVTSAGPGALPELCSPEDGLRPAEYWKIPRTYIAAFTEEPDKLAIIRVAGDSMEPEYQAGDRVLIDTAHRIPSPPGIYVLWDGFGLVLKRLELLPGMEEPRRVRIMSINPAYSSYELTLEEISINGRVIGKWAWK